ncbi:MAG: hypothetical protein CVU55_06145 [Deltaproteobacteria bacterium HGW-Deltaproteobacteria-13]|nr:MAG: hypothetical protein CVU55_06145 [Deltaproteobacteria bacterium HGW-Deltaproteobacteria-13]
MATQFEIDCALMAGCVYRSNRYENANWFPVPNGWSEIELSHMTDSNGSGFEAVSFKSGNKIVISFCRNR